MKNSFFRFCFENKYEIRNDFSYRLNLNWNCKRKTWKNSGFLFIFLKVPYRNAFIFASSLLKGMVWNYRMDFVWRCNGRDECRRIFTGKKWSLCADSQSAGKKNCKRNKNMDTDFFKTCHIRLRSVSRRLSCILFINSIVFRDNPHVTERLKNIDSKIFTNSFAKGFILNVFCAII